MSVSRAFGGLRERAHPPDPIDRRLHPIRTRHPPTLVYLKIGTALHLWLAATACEYSVHLPAHKRRSKPTTHQTGHASKFHPLHPLPTTQRGATTRPALPIPPAQPDSHPQPTNHRRLCDRPLFGHPNPGIWPLGCACSSRLLLFDLSGGASPAKGRLDDNLYNESSKLIHDDQPRRRTTDETTTGYLRLTATHLRLLLEPRSATPPRDLESSSPLSVPPLDVPFLSTDFALCANSDFALPTPQLQALV